MPARRLKAEYPDHVWALDYQHDATDDGHELKFLNVVDEFTSEALAIEVGRGIDAEQTVAVLQRLAAERGAPANIRSDNGPELTAAVLREWCRLGGTGTAYIEPGSPWQNAYVESFNSRFRDEVLTPRSSPASRRLGSSPRTGAPTTTPTIRTRPSG